MTTMAGQTTANAIATRQWFTEGWRGNIALADTLFAECFATNGAEVGPVGPKRNIVARLDGFPDLTTEVEDIVATGDMVVIRVLWRGTHTGFYAGVPATGRPVQVRVISMWRFEQGRVVENWTLQDQFSLLQQIGFLAPELTAAQVRDISHAP